MEDDHGDRTPDLPAGPRSAPAPDRGGSGPLGVAASDLSDDELVRELASLHRTRHDALRHRPGAALGHRDRRSHELEAEYLRRFPEREVPRSEPGPDQHSRPG
jgi:hypothetical protein